MYLPGSVVRYDLVHVANVHHILGLALVVGDTSILEPVAPQDLIGKVAGADLENKTIKCLIVPRLFPARLVHSHWSRSIEALL